MARSRVADGRMDSNMESTWDYIRIISRGHSAGGGPPAWGSGEVPTTPRNENLSYYEPFTKPLVNAVMNLRVP